MRVSKLLRVCAALALACLALSGCVKKDGGAADPATTDVRADAPADDEVASPPPFQVDLLVVVDDSPSMCHEQGTLAGLYAPLIEALGTVDLRVAVTSTNVCPVGSPGAVRGRFLYQPMTSDSVNPSCFNRRIRACMTDADCQGDPSLPDAAHWVCEGNSVASLHVCDAAPAPIVLDAVRSTCRYKCVADSDSCPTVFGDDGARCVTPGGDSAYAGCLPRLPTGDCPAQAPTVLDASSAGANAATLFACMASVGVQQGICGSQEQGLAAAWMALDPAGENADQARAFQRSDAVLVVFVVSNEDDCSTTGKLSAELYGQCACLADTAGCLPDGTCGLEAGPLTSVGALAQQLKSLKPDPTRVVFASVSGDAIPGSTTTPGTDVQAARARFQSCRCQNPSMNDSYFAYVCGSDTGWADLGSRYHAMAVAFGERGVASNLCDPDGIRKGLVSAAQAARRAAGLP